jgi:flagellar hook-basal body complex protein FliE
MSDILYNFGSNISSLEEINGMIQSIQEVRTDIDSIFTTLESVYEGQGAMGLNQARTEISNMLDEALNNTANTQKQAQDQQDAMQALDRANAADF